MIGWFAPGGASERVGGWRESDGTKVERRVWASQAEQVAYLRAMVDVYREREAMRRKAIAIAFDQYRCARKDKTAQALALGTWVRDHVTYVEELPERFYLPLRLLAQPHPAADCDDFTVLIASLCESLGIRCRLVAASWGGGFRHIWPEAWTGTRWLVLDGTMREPVGIANPYKTLVEKYGDDARVLRV
jgi:transglutaminase-like putative cysteine protease